MFTVSNGPEGSGMKKSLQILILLALGGACAVPAKANPLKLVVIKGEGVELCEICLKNLRRIPDDPACDRTYDMRLGLQEPEWETLDFAKNRSLVSKVINLLDDGTELPSQDEHARKASEDFIDSLAERDDTRLQSTQVDIDNDGKVDQVLRLNIHTCHETRLYARPLVVLNEKGTSVDPLKTDLVSQNRFRHPELKGTGFSVGKYHYQIYGIFRYQSKTYFDKWDADQEQFSVYATSAGKTQELCKFKFQYLAPGQGGTP